MFTARYSLNHTDVASELLDGEAIVIHLTSGAYYSFGECSAEIWAGVLAGWSADELIAALARACDDNPPTITPHVVDFIDFLRKEELIIPRPTDDVDTTISFATRDAFVAPEIQKFTDMQELLLVDPIHEVTEAGWPLRETPEV